MRPRRIGGTLAAPLLALIIATAAGCAKKSDDGGIATAGGQPTAAATTAAAGNQGEQFRKFAQCMRDNGVDVPDPGPDGTYSFGGQGGADRTPGVDRDDPKFQAAMTACRSLMPAGGIPIKLNPQQLELYRVFAACMREQGIDFPDPNADGTLAIDMANAERLMDRNNPAFTKAARACIGSSFTGQTPGATP